MRDALAMSLGCVREMFAHGRMMGIEATFLAVVIALACAFGCHKSAWLWNLKYSQTFPGFGLCLLAGIIGFWSTLVYAGAGFAKEAAIAVVNGWGTMIWEDHGWKDGVFAKAKQSVKDLKDPKTGRSLEDFSLIGPDHVRYDDPKSAYIPSQTSKSREAVSFVYSKETIHSFRSAHPILGWFLFANQEQSSELMSKDTDSYFAEHPGTTYRVDRGFKLALQQIVRELEGGTDRLVRIARVGVIVFFAAGEAFSFGIVGFIAYRKLRIDRQTFRT
jgi:hypothetical protein